MICSSSRKVLRTSLSWTFFFAPSSRRFPCRARFSSSSKDPEQDSAGRLISRKRSRSTKKLKTVKEYSALPERLVLINGTSAEPLPSWDGGLGTPSHNKREKDVNADSNEQNARLLPESSSAPSSDAEREKPVAKKRKRKTRSSDTSLGDGTVDAPVLHVQSSVIMQDGRRPPQNVLAREILENLSKFPHCILLTRVGQFYESYFDQAQEVSRLLSIKLTQRTWGGQRIWMCGFPLMHLDKYLKILVQQYNRSVAMCEEFRKPRDANDDLNTKASFERRVVRILTPGTLIDEPFLNPYENNFLLAIARDDKASQHDVGMAWIDVSTGEFYTRSTSLDTLKDHIARISPREVVLDTAFESDLADPIRSILSDSNCLVSFSDRTTGSLEDVITPTNEIVDDIVDLNNSFSVFSSAETAAIAVLNSFLQANLLEHAPHSLRPLREDKAQRMQIDAHTLKALEIRESIREGGTSGSLMSSIRRTVTSSGARLLARWLCSPSTSLDEILARQSLVNLYLTRPTLRTDLIELLKGAEDAMRISQRFLLGKGGVDDLVSIRNTIGTWKAIQNRVILEKECEKSESEGNYSPDDWRSLDHLMNRMTDLSGLAEQIESAIDPGEIEKEENASDESEDKELLVPGPLSSDGPKFLSLPGTDLRWTIKPQFSERLALLHEGFYQLQDERENLQKKYQEQYDAPSLTLRHSPSHGLHVHLAKPRRDAERLDKSRHFVQLAESRSTKTYFNQEWFTLGNAILETVSSIYSEERDAFLSLRHETNLETSAIRKNARILDELDVTSAFASLASEMNFVRPTISESSTFYIQNGRHPTVELGLLQTGRMFTPNTVSMSDRSRLHIVTGPNMGGKSTYLRQAALIAILAQTGSFVPADTAHIGLVDKVFSRVGAKDDLFRDRSTFMVEMLESAEILKNATERSLVIMDEVGRGTTVQDGLAIAFATVHHLYFVNRSRTLFATHFHELVDMLGFSETSQNSDLFPDLEFYCTDIDELEDGHFTYSHRMRPGVNRNSQGLKVAQLAGMPILAISIAEKALSTLKSHKEPSSTFSLQNLGRELAYIQTSITAR
ncbi:hypothetical protein ACEPAF_3565 [Sanghuangporus sanghuang]